MPPETHATNRAAVRCQHRASGSAGASSMPPPRALVHFCTDGEVTNERIREVARTRLLVLRIGVWRGGGLARAPVPSARPNKFPARNA